MLTPVCTRVLVPEFSKLEAMNGVAASGKGRHRIARLFPGVSKILGEAQSPSGEGTEVRRDASKDEVSEKQRKDIETTRVVRNTDERV